MKALKVGKETSFFYVPNEVFWEVAKRLCLDTVDITTLCLTSTEGTRLHISPETSPDGSKIYYDPKEKANADSPTDPT